MCYQLQTTASSQSCLVTLSEKISPQTSMSLSYMSVSWCEILLECTKAQPSSVRIKGMFHFAITNVNRLTVMSSKKPG